MSHLGFIRGFSYSKTDFICTLFRWIMHGYPVATLEHGISGYEFRWSADLEFVAVRSESGLVYMEALAW